MTGLYFLQKCSGIRHGLKNVAIHARFVVPQDYEVKHLVE